MASSSSTFNSDVALQAPSPDGTRAFADLGPNERVSVARIPIAAVVFLIALVLIEVTASANRAWFADLAAWQWESKRTLLDSSALDGDVAIFGTSVLFHGLDTTSPGPEAGAPHVVNLALNGMELQHETQLLRERLASPRPPSMAVLELRQVAVERDSWIRGPYFRFWASWGDFFDSRFFYWNPALALTFAANRALPSFRYREALDNWIFESIANRGPSRHTLDRNREATAEMQAHAGQVRGQAFENSALPPHEPAPRRWVSDRAGEIWIRRFLDVAAAHHTRVTLFLTPAPPYFVEEPGPDGFRARFTAEVEQLRHEYPSLKIDVWEPTGYELADFADTVHLNARGREQLSRDFAEWLTKSRT